jgi:hypothetical protein
MPNLRRVLFGLSAGALLFATPALADWEADLQLKPRAGSMGPGAPQEMQGKAHGRQAAVRMDVESPRGPMSVLIDWDKHQVTMLMHSMKMMMQRDSAQDSEFPSCSAKDTDACLVSQGFKKTGTETANGHPCAVYEKTTAGGKAPPAHIKLWRPTDLKEVPFVRSQSSNDSGVTGSLDLTNVKIAPQPASLFVAPADYKSMQMPAGAPGAHPGGAPSALNPADFQGKTPEQIREMIQQRMGQQTVMPEPSK